MRTRRVALALAALTVPALAQQIDTDLLGGLRARSIGPAGMSGRVTAVCGVIQNPNIFYVGAATGGLWKSTDGGLRFEPIFDDQSCASIGAIAVHERSPDIVWVGTGEGNPRNSVSVGRGVFRSDDGGRSWRHLGLENTERIRRIRLHPTDPDIAYVAALGTTWGENEQRGVFKTTDGGRSWEKVLYVDKTTGCANLVLDPSNPDKLFANMWQHRRWPWFFESGGPGSGLHRSVNGGRTWTKLTSKDGLPEGDLGRIGLGIARSNPNVVYALVEAKKSALVRSDDGGVTFRTVNDDADIASRPFYYADIRIDPKDPDRVINMHTTVTVSEDGGKTFGSLIAYNEIHPDHHAMWIHPEDPRLMIEGNDGGVSISRDRGKSWRFVANLPLSQLYHIDVDMDVPYNVYGGMQDNGSWRGPSAVWENGGIRNHHWQEVCFGDGFQTLPYPADSLQGYAMSQQGNLVRWNLHTGERKDIKPAGPHGVDLRFNWNAGIAQDPFDQDTIYLGSQLVHKSTDRGDSWEVISPDLTSDFEGWQKQDKSGGLTFDVTGAENYTTIIAIAASPVQKDVLWVGTDDGRVHLTQNGGKTWKSLEANIPGVPRNTWVPHIEASKHDAKSAFVVFDDHRRASWQPYAFRTDDFGETWQSIANDSIDGYCLVIEQDPVTADLLFLGTEFGFYFSIDGGKTWSKFDRGFPTVSAMDIAVHPRDGDLIVGTHGRGAYVIDDIRPLRELAVARSKALHLFAIPPAYQHTVGQTAPPRFAGATEFRGENRPVGAMISFWAKGSDDEKSPGKAKVEIAGADGKVVRKMDVDAKAGVNRFTWMMNRDSTAARSERGEQGEQGEQGERGERGEQGEQGGRGARGRGRGRGRFGGGGLPVLPGKYTVKITLGESEASGDVEIRPDPRVEIAPDARAAKLAAMEQAQKISDRFRKITERLSTTRERLDTVRDHVKSLEKEKRTDAIKALQKAADAAAEALKELSDRISGTSEGQGITRRESMAGDIRRPLGSLRSSWDAPTAAQRTYLDRAEKKLAALVADFNTVLEGPVATYNGKLATADLSFAADVTPVK